MRWPAASCITRLPVRYEMEKNRAQIERQQMVHPKLARWLALGLALLTVPAAVAQQPDSLAPPPLLPDTAAVETGEVPGVEAAPLGPFPGHHPEGALWRAVAVPGWGQFYNRQYYKIPIVYLGLGGAVAAILYTNDRYLLYRNAFRYAQGQEILADSVITQEERARCADFDCNFDRYAEEGRRFSAIIEAGQSNLLRREREKFRRNRDLSVIGLGVFYGLTIVDAYVSAHLLGFDVGEDLSASLRPRPEGVQMTLRYRF